MKLRYERGALADLDEIFTYIAKDNREAAGRLVARIEGVAARIAASPYIGETARDPGFRRLRVSPFPQLTKGPLHLFSSFGFQLCFDLLSRFGI